MGTPAKTQEKQSSKRREAIIEKAAALFARQGVRTTTVRDIAEAAGMLAGSLYYHFESKDEIVEEILGRSLGDLFGSYREVFDEHEDPSDRLSGLIRASFKVIVAHPTATAIYLKDRDYLLGLPRFSRYRKIESEAVQAWTSVVTEGIARGQFRPDIDPMLFYRFAVYPIWWTVIWIESERRSVDELADHHIALVMKGISRAKSVPRPQKRRPAKRKR